MTESVNSPQALPGLSMGPLGWATPGNLSPTLHLLPPPPPPSPHPYANLFPHPQRPNCQVLSWLDQSPALRERFC